MGLLRILLALSIIVVHSHPLFGFSLLGRDTALRAFYLVSGFYMSLILNEKYIKKNNSYFLFISNRILRLFPTYWIILILTYATNFIFFHQSIFKESLFYIVRDFTLMIRTDYLQINTNFRDPFTMGVMYTLVLEFCFYFVSPFIVKRKLNFLLSLTFIALLVHFFVLVVLRLLHQPPEDWFFPEVIIFFLLGILSYKLYVFLKKRVFSNYAVFMTYSFIIFVTFFYDRLPNIFLVKNLIDVREWTYLFLLVFSIPIIFKATSRIKIDRFFGEITYTVYLSHLLIYTVLIQTGLVPTTGDFSIIVLIISTFVFSTMIFYFVENPIDKIRQRRLLVPEKKK